MSIVPYERQIEPQVVKSPFLRGVKGPGFLAEPRRQANAEDDEEYEMKKRPSEPSTEPSVSVQRVEPSVPPPTTLPAYTPTPILHDSLTLPGPTSESWQRRR